MTTLSENLFKAGDVLNQKWVILEFIGKGGVGEVYRAHQVSLNRDVAIKVMLKEWLEGLDKDDEEAETLAQRFRREVQAMALICHPNVLQVFDYDSVTVQRCGQDTPIEYIAMEYVSGGTLRTTMSEEGFYPDQAAIGRWITNYFIPVLVGVQALHDLEIVHRDLKPENILMENTIPKIADFGLARSCRLKPVTQSIDVKGSPQYMSPEHYFDFKRADKRADIYSLGKILFEAVEGKIKSSTIPFQRVGLTKTESPFLQQLNRIIQSATAEKKEERTESVQDLREQLEQVVKAFEAQGLSASPDRRRPVSLFARPKWLWAGIVVITLFAVFVTIWHFMGEPGWNFTKAGFEQGQGGHESPTKSDNAEATANLDTVDSLTDSEHIGNQHLITGGELIIPASASGSDKQTVQLEPFYIDEFLVTNQQFVDFLNHNLAKISLEKDVVTGDGANWLLLGEVRAGYEPIVYKNEKFHISNPAYISNPALRVTGYGATAFANFFDRRLLMEAELLYVMIKGAAQLNTKEEPLPSDRSANTRIESHLDKLVFSMALFTPNTLGIRGLNEGLGEWVLKSSTASSEDQTKMRKYAVIGGLEGTHPNSPLPKSVARFAWEGFEEIGFRTAKTAADSASLR
ncbi:MAG: bifunctional serine/threonine-protein kinase/formylglycine-generating enzyme family protein [Desulforhopalus sp.]|nr:bifunctional serine/threonine-protein kinase/formylglycine-generating enzyme family protein [Desulforhopalus sp.]